jgi:hypothetical protein
VFQGYGSGFFRVEKDWQVKMNATKIVNFQAKSKQQPARKLIYY